MLKNSILKTQYISFKRVLQAKSFVCEDGISLIYILTNINRHALNNYIIINNWIKNIAYNRIFGNLKFTYLQILIDKFPEHFKSIPGIQLYSIVCNKSIVSVLKWTNLILAQAFWTNNWVMLINYLTFIIKYLFKIYQFYIISIQRFCFMFYLIINYIYIFKKY